MKFKIGQHIKIVHGVLSGRTGDIEQRVEDGNTIAPNRAWLYTKEPAYWVRIDPNPTDTIIESFWVDESLIKRSR